MTVYADSGGTSVVTDGNAIDTTSSSPAAGWVPRPLFDYVGAVPSVAYDATSTATPLSGAASTLSWSHSASGSNRLVLVGVSWQDSISEETLDSVTYNGVAMTEIGSTSFTALFALVNPPTGSKTVVATWSGSNTKGAIGGSISFTGVDQSIPYIPASIATGNSTSPSVSVPPAHSPGIVFSLVGVNCAASAPTLSVGSGLTQRWNSQAGSSGATTLTLGGGATATSNGSSKTLAWSLSAARIWGAIAVAVRSTARLQIDLAGGATPSTAWVDARNFPDLQSAADEVAPGGTLNIPNGDYSVPSGGLVIRKSICLQGEPGTRLFSYSAATNQPVISLAPGGALIHSVVIRDLTLQNATAPTSPVSGNYGIVCDVASDGSKVAFLTLERVVVNQMGDDGIHLHALGENDSYFVSVALRDVQSQNNQERGLFASFANQLNCYGSFFVDNQLDGVRAEESEVTFHGCVFQNNCLSDDEERLDETFNGQVYLVTCAISRFDGCHFEDFTGETHPRSKRGLMIENGPCCTVSGCRFTNAAVDTSENERGIACTFGAGKQTPVPGVMACCILPNWFDNVNTVIEVDPGEGAAQDCVVFPQRINLETAQMILPTELSDSGIVLLGHRRLGEEGLARGVFVPPHSSGGGSLPTLISEPAGYILFDTDNTTLALWDGTIWRRVALT